LSNNLCGGALSRRSFSLQLLIAFAAGAICHFGIAPFDFQAIAVASISILFAQLTLNNNINTKQHFLIGLSYGVGLFLAGLRWVHVSLDQYGGLPLPVTLALLCLLALYLAIFPALTSLAFAKLKRSERSINALIFASLWILLEFARGKALTGFPWLWLGYSQTQGIFSQSAATIGALGLSFVVALVGALVVNVLKRSLASGALLVVTLIAMSALSSIDRITISDKSINLALIQGNIEQTMKWQRDAMWPTIGTYMKLTRENFDADVIIWPEAAIPAVEAWVEDYLHAIDQEAKSNNSAIITGVIARKINRENSDNKPLKQHYNALITLGQSSNGDTEQMPYHDAHSNRYYKHQLLPIGEFVPFEDLLRPLAPLFNLPMSSFNRGDAVQPDLTAVGMTFTPAICYEITFSELVRANLKPDSDFIVTVSNDAWFGQSIGPHQHMQLAQMRAIELGRPVVRVTNNGITGVVNHRGEITARLPQFKQAVLRTDLHRVSGQTFYYQYGQSPVLWLSLLIVAFALLQRLRAAANPPTVATTKD